MNKKVTCASCSSNRCFVKRHCSPEWNSIVNDKKSQLYYSRGKNIIDEGAAVLGIYFICKGKVKVISADQNNINHIVRLATNGHVLGHRGFGKQSYPIGAVTMQESLVCFLDNELVHKLMMHNPEFTYGLMAHFAQELSNAELRAKYLPQMTVKERVADAILHLMETFGLTPVKKLDITISMEEIGDLAGASAKQVDETIGDFEKEMTLITEGKDIIILNPTKLRRLVEH